jgi:hypothetical protein
VRAGRDARETRLSIADARANRVWVVWSRTPPRPSFLGVRAFDDYPLDELRAVPEPQRAQRFPGIQMFIDPDECIDCGACMAECPVAAIYLDDDVPAEHRGDIARNAKFFGRTH